METIVKVGVGRLLALSHLFQQNYADATSEEWIRWQEKSVAQIWHTKYEIYRRKKKTDVEERERRKSVWGYENRGAERKE